MPRVLQALKRGSLGDVPEPFRGSFDDGHLGPRHKPVLMAVTFFGPLGVSEIAQRIGLSVGTASLMVGELDRAGMLERSVDESDRRRTIVALPDGYREAMDVWVDERVQPLRRALERMSKRHRRDFLEGWRIIEEEAAVRGESAIARSEN
ncbi:MAG: MarR family winged helix-turn-helix transcriptional regulator [Solirubrobacterales bacterium]